MNEAMNTNFEGKKVEEQKKRSINLDNGSKKSR